MARRGAAVIVIDCSYTLAMVMPDEPRPSSLDQVATGRLLVPPIWPYEVANAFRSAVRRGRVAEPEIMGVCARIEGLQFELTGSHDTAVRHRYLAAMSHGLTAYDAAYVELALQRRCPLATLDAALASVAVHAGLDVLQ
jgi:predicted nucleic acid-binding protein